MAILSKLPECFKHLIVAFEAKIGDRKRTSEFVKSRFLQGEQQINERIKKKTGSDAALIVRQVRKKP